MSLLASSFASAILATPTSLAQNERRREFLFVGSHFPQNFAWTRYKHNLALKNVSVSLDKQKTNSCRNLCSKIAKLDKRNGTSLFRSEKCGEFSVKQIFRLEVIAAVQGSAVISRKASATFSCAKIFYSFSFLLLIQLINCHQRRRKSDLATRDFTTFA